LKGRWKWVKKEVNEKKPKKDDKPKAKPTEKKKKDKLDTPIGSSQASWVLDINMTVEVLDKKVNELFASRGRKGTDIRAVLRQFEVLAKISRVFGPVKEIPVLMHLVSAIYDINKLIDDYLDLQTWRACHRYISRIVKLLDENKSFVLSLVPTDDSLSFSQADDKKKDVEVKVKGKSEEIHLRVIGTLEHFVTRLKDEYTKSLQQINPHTQVSST